MDPQVVQSLQAIAAQVPAMRADLDLLVNAQTQSTALAASNTVSNPTGYLNAWTVAVNSASQQSSPYPVLKATLSNGPAGGLLVSNPTSNALTILLFTQTVPSSTSAITQGNAVQSLSIRPYSWQSVSTLPWNALAVLTFGDVVSAAKSAVVGAFTSIAPGSGLMQEDITSAMSKYWVETSLVAGDKISLTSPWGGTINVVAATIAGAGKVTTIRIAPGFYGSVAGTVAGCSLLLGENYGGSLTIQSVRNLNVQFGSDVLANLTIPHYGRDSAIKLGNSVKGSAIWSSQTSTLDVGDNALLASTTGTGIMTFGLANTAGIVFANVVRVGAGAILMANFPADVSATAGQFRVLMGNQIIVGDGAQAIVSLSSSTVMNGADVSSFLMEIGANAIARISSSVSGTDPLISSNTLRVGRNVEAASFFLYSSFGNPINYTDIGVSSTYAIVLTNAEYVRIMVPPSAMNYLAHNTSYTSALSNVSGFVAVPGNRPIWTNISTTYTASFTSPILPVGDCPQLSFKSKVTAAKGSLTWVLQTLGRDGEWYTQYSSSAISATGTLVASFGPGLQYNMALGQTIRMQATIVAGTTSITTPSFSLSYSLDGTGGEA